MTRQARSLGTLVLSHLVLVIPALAAPAGAAPEGQMTWAIHFSSIGPCSRRTIGLTLDGAGRRRLPPGAPAVPAGLSGSISLPAALTALMLLWGSVCHHVERGVSIKYP